MTEIKLLDEQALKEIERHLEISPDGAVVWSSVPSLITTIRSLQAQLRLCEQAFEIDAAMNDPDVGELNALRIVRQVAKANGLRDCTLSAIKDKAEEWQEMFDKDVTGDYDDKVYYARAAREIIKLVEDTGQ